ncbi:MAG TPA: hypothetical protein VGZ29_07325 [Terriglobia bacterium]|nr:hypothetical protein [Terriglobia bacterium]
MLILFDNGVPAPLRHALEGHVVVEAIQRGWDRLADLFKGRARGKCFAFRARAVESSSCEDAGMTFVLSDYVRAALTEAEYDRLDDGSYAGRIPSCEGVLAFSGSLLACEDELRSTLKIGFCLACALAIRCP